MATADMSGLFGPTPYEIQQAQQQALQSQASAYANQSPFQRAAQGMFTAGGQAAGMGAQAMGMVNPAVEQAKQQQSAMQGADLQTPEGLRAAAKKMLDVGNQKSAYLLGQKATEIENARATAALAQQKQDESEQFRRDQLTAKIEQDKAALEARAKYEQGILDSKSASEETKRAIAQQHDQTLLMIKNMDAQNKQLIASMRESSKIGEKPISPAQAFKQKQLEAKSAGQLRGMDNSVENLTSAATAITSHPGLSSATGLTSLIPSIPGGAASQVDNLINEFKSGVKKTGLDLVRQGGGIGAMSEKEWPIVEGMVADINPRAGKEAVIGQIQKVLAKVDQVRQNAYQTHNEGFDTGLAPKPISPSAPPPVPKVVSPQDQQALQWANANPADPRSAAIKKRLGQ